MNDENFPRVLLVMPNAFNNVTGGGITFSHLFAGWPKDRLATIHCDTEPTTGNVCEKYFVLGEREIRHSAPVSILRNLLGREAIEGGPTGPSETFPLNREQTRFRIVTGLGSILRKASIWAVGENPAQRVELSDRLSAWIDGFRPDLLYSNLGTTGMMQLVEKIRSKYQLITIVHFMDDWMSSRHRRGIFNAKSRPEMEMLVSKLVRDADTCLGISDAMCSAFKGRYGRSFEAFQNTIEVTRWSAYTKEDTACGSPADILYIGSISPSAQLESLVRCCQAVATINERGLNATLTISSPSGHADLYRHRLVMHPAIQIIDTIHDDESFFRRIGKADLLLLPVNFDEESVRYIRYSMPTKVPAYLMSGTPILAHGPLETAQIAYAESEGWALIVAQPSVELLASKLELVLSDTALRANLSVRAREVAAQRHDSTIVRSRFREVLRLAAERAPRAHRMAHC